MSNVSLFIMFEDLKRIGRKFILLKPIISRKVLHQTKIIFFENTSEPLQKSVCLMINKLLRLSQNCTDSIHDLLPITQIPSL